MCRKCYNLLKRKIFLILKLYLRRYEFFKIYNLTPKVTVMVDLIGR